MNNDRSHIRAIENKAEDARLHVRTFIEENAVEGAYKIMDQRTDIDWTEELQMLASRGKLRPNPNAPRRTLNLTHNSFWHNGKRCRINPTTRRIEEIP